MKATGSAKIGSATFRSTSRRALPARRRARYSLRARVLLALTALIASLLAAEASLRVWLHYRQQHRAAQWREFVLNGRGPTKKGINMAFVDMIVTSRHRDIIYELIPGLSGRFVNAAVSVNAHGFRGPSIRKDKPEDVYRIIGLGDSVMFGWGVDDGEEFLQVMQRKLNEHPLPKRVEVLNTAVPGYNTVMEVATLRERCLDWSPDLVIVDFVDNDYSLPNMIGAAVDYASLDRSVLWDWLVTSGTQSAGFAPLRKAPSHDGAFVDDPAMAPPEYRHMVGPAAVHRAFGELLDLSRRHGFGIAVTTHRRQDTVVADTCHDLDIWLLDAGPAIDRQLKARGGGTYLGSEMTVSDSDPHPSALQHRLLGELYAQMLLQTGWIR